MSDIPPEFQDENESDHWISVADLMAGLMVVFMFIAISYIIFGRDETEKERRIQAEQATQIGNLETQKEQLEDTTQDLVKKYEQNLEEQTKQLEQIENLKNEIEQLKNILEDTTEDSVEAHKQRFEEKKQRLEQIETLENEKIERSAQIEILENEKTEQLAQIETLENEKTEQLVQTETLQEEKEQLENAIESTTYDSEKKYQQKLETWKQDLEKLIKAQEIERVIYLALQKEFKNDLLKWADILPDLTIRFKHPDILFDTDKDILKPDFKALLDDFIPRYLRVLTVFENSIEEIRIEGHTSSKWGDAQTPIEAYFKNMALSQSRTRAVLEYSLDQIGAWYSHDWARPLLTANGLSSSRLVKPDGIENPELSRRVEFKIRTKVKQEILKTLEGLQ